MKNRIQLNYCHLFIFHFGIYHYYYEFKNLMAHQSTSVTSFILLIYILVTLVQRCCSCPPLGLSSATAAMLLFPPCLIGYIYMGYFFPVLKLLSSNRVFSSSLL